MDISENDYISGRYWQQHGHSESSYKVELLLSAAEKVGLSFQDNFKGIEIGCGNGAFLIPLERSLGKSLNRFKLIGYDIAHNGIVMAKERMEKRQKERLSFVVGSAADIKEKVDYIFLMDVLEHVENPYSFLKELSNKANYIFLHLPLENTLAHVILGKLRRAYKKFRHLHFFSWDSANIMLEECRYNLVGYQFTGACQAGLDIHGSFGTKALRYLRFAAYRFFPNITVTLAGGSVMMILETANQ